MQVLLLDTTQQSLKILPKNDLVTCYKYIHTNFIRFTIKNICGLPVFITFDGEDEDEKNARNKNIVTAFDPQEKPILFGNLIISKYDKDSKSDEDESLTDDEIRHICKNTKIMDNGTEQYPVLINVGRYVKQLNLPDADKI